MEKKPNEIDAPDEDTIIRFKGKQLKWIGGVIVALLLLLTGAYGIYSNLENRLANMEDTKDRFQSTVRGELPALVEKEVKERLKRDNQIATLLNDYTCEELTLQVSDINKIIDLKNCPR